VLFRSGRGFLTPVIVVAAFILVQLTANALFGPHTYESSSTWPGLALLLSAVAVWPVGQRLNNGAGRQLLDPASGEAAVLPPAHTFFFLRMEYWAVVLAVGAVIAFVAGLS
jgi:hypothetical protein